jgi:hypothetical protein
MMIAKSWMDITANVAGRQHPSPHFSPRFPNDRTQVAGAIQRVMPNKRDREVPYGMKGGEQDGREEKSCC